MTVDQSQLTDHPTIQAYSDGCLGGQQVSQSDGWLVGWMVGWLDRQMVGWLVGWLVGQVSYV